MIPLQEVEMTTATRTPIKLRRALEVISPNFDHNRTNEDDTNQYSYSLGTMIKLGKIFGLADDSDGLRNCVLNTEELCHPPG